MQEKILAMPSVLRGKTSHAILIQVPSTFKATFRDERALRSVHCPEPSPKGCHVWLCDMNVSPLGTGLSPATPLVQA